MKDLFEHKQNLQYVTMFADDLRYMTGNAYGWGNKEIGGAMLSINDRLPYHARRQQSM